MNSEVSLLTSSVKLQLPYSVWACICWSRGKRLVLIRRPALLERRCSFGAASLLPGASRYCVASNETGSLLRAELLGVLSCDCPRSRSRASRASRKAIRANTLDAPALMALILGSLDWLSRKLLLLWRSCRALVSCLRVCCFIALSSILWCFSFSLSSLICFFSAYFRRWKWASFFGTRS